VGRRAALKAYKFLCEGATGVLSGFTWPVGDWVVVEGDLVPSRRGVHACRHRDLAYWLDEELWEVELDGEVQELDRLVVARAGRLVRRIDAWAPDLARELAHVAVDRRRELPGLVEDAELWHWDPPSAAYMAAHALGCAAQERGEDYTAAFEAERAWQGAWLADRLGLTA
jgi:hypothetical protein